jgi:hypothetical protein
MSHVLATTHGPTEMGAKPSPNLRTGERLLPSASHHDRKLEWTTLNVW